MEKRRGKFLGIIAIFLSFLIASAYSLSITNPSILDTDPATYVIVVMLMLFLFILFSAKEDLEFKFSWRNIIYGLAVFGIYVVLLASLRVALSFSFLSYRIDALLFPVLLISLILPVFGARGVRKLLPVVVYSIFASPLLLMPLLGLNNAFANLNATFVYGFVKVLGVPVSKAGVRIFAGAGSSIAISTTCVSIGTFIALFMFLLPLAYLYDGRLGRKALWLVSGVALILLFNILRMLTVVLIWVYYGIGSAANTFHVFAGQFLFYLAIILMLLVSGKYAFGLDRLGKDTRKDLARFYMTKRNGIYTTVALLMVLALVSLFLASGYGRQLYAPPALFGNESQLNNLMLNERVISSLHSSGDNVTELGDTPVGYIFALSNNAVNVNSSVYVVANVSYSPLPSYNVPAFTPVSAAHAYLLNDGVTVTAQSALSENNLFDVNYFSVPYNISGDWVSVNYLMFRRVNSGPMPDCGALRSSLQPQGLVETYIYNMFSSQNYGTRGFMCEGYNVASSA
ncbi:MAG: exosortase/archaeosortase family protein [Candidatus Micrarchaeaceae archaeon]|jgi:exosortase/archaeosortase family protein|nr:exosortase/archaeosortase family protein [Candidatus Micrarchaeota archaeon]HII09955.1 exosortase/archaeosortase family protein [Candidatus Micrarchaeota archaeon]